MEKMKKIFAIVGVMTIIGMTGAQALVPATATTSNELVCNAGDTRKGDTCTHITPAVPATADTTQNMPAESYPATPSTSGSVAFTSAIGAIPNMRYIVFYHLDGSYIGEYRIWNTPTASNTSDIKLRVFDYTYGNILWQGTFNEAVNAGYLEVQTTTTYSCPNGGTLSGSDCVTKDAYVKTIKGQPATPEQTSTYLATSQPVTTYSCPNGGTLAGQNCVQGISDAILAPVPVVKGFVTSHLLPVITGFVLLSISIGLAVKVVRKFGRRII